MSTGGTLNFKHPISSPRSGPTSASTSLIRRVSSKSPYRPMYYIFTPPPRPNEVSCRVIETSLEFSFFSNTGSLLTLRRRSRQHDRRHAMPFRAPPQIVGLHIPQLVAPSPIHGTPDPRSALHYRQLSATTLGRSLTLHDARPTRTALLSASQGQETHRQSARRCAGPRAER